MSQDSDVEVMSDNMKQMSKNQLRRKLIEFLIASPPPLPLAYSSFEVHVKSQCRTYYDLVLQEVYDSLTTQWNRNGTNTITPNMSCTMARIPVHHIAISDSDDSESEEASVGNGACDVVSTPKNGCDSKRQSESDASDPLTVEEMKDLREEKSTKKYIKYLKEIYELIKGIRKTTSCSVCVKLNARIQKFVLHVSRESDVVKQRVAKELRCQEISMDHHHLTEDQCEKIRLDILIDKLIEISMPDLLKSAKQTTLQSGIDETKSAVKRTKRSRRSVDQENEVENEQNKRRTSKGKKRKSTGNEEELTKEVNTSKARKISVKITETPHPDLT